MNDTTGVHKGSSSQSKIALFRSLFRGREDVYPRRFESLRTGKSGYPNLLRRFGIEPSFDDQRHSGVPISVSFQGDLRPEQQMTVSAMLAHDTGVLAATTAFGKCIGSDFIVRVLAVSQDDENDAIVATGITELANFARISVLRNHEWNTKYQLLQNTKTPEIPISAGGLPIVDMGHSSHIEVSTSHNAFWELHFYKNGDKVDQPSPEIIQVEALKGDGTICNLQVSAGPRPSTLVASGSIADTTRMRLLWAHGDHFHRREFNLPV